MNNTYIPTTTWRIAEPLPFLVTVWHMKHCQATADAAQSFARHGVRNAILWTGGSLVLTYADSHSILAEMIGEDCLIIRRCGPASGTSADHRFIDADMSLPTLAAIAIPRGELHRQLSPHSSSVEVNSQMPPQHQGDA